MAEYLDQWPSLAQVCRITRRRIRKGKESVEVVHAITSLRRQKAGAERLLELDRGHWGIENKLHYVRDVTFHEDACRTRADNAPQALAALRNIALTVIRRLGFKPPDAHDHFAEFRLQALQIIRSGRTE